MSGLDAVVVGSGPNGLAAAITLAARGLRVRVIERETVPGGGTRTGEGVAPGFVFDLCSAVHPMAVASPFFRSVGLQSRVRFVVPDISFGHPLDGGRAVLAYRDLAATAAALGADGARYHRLVAPLVAHLDQVSAAALGGIEGALAHPIGAALLGARVLEQGSSLRRLRFRGQEAPALLGGVSAHLTGRLPSPPAAGAGLLLAAYAHSGGWPLPAAGSRSIASALAAILADHGGTVECGREVTSLAELVAATGAKLVLLDVGPAAFAAMAGSRLPDRYRRRIERFRYGNGACKVDFALREPVPWLAPALASAGTVHICGSFGDLAAAEAQVAAGRHSDRPFVLAVQPTPHDPTRAPAGCHVLSTYAHVPAGSTLDMTGAVTNQISRFAPAFRDVVIASEATPAADLQLHNPNLVGGDIAGGAMTTRQLLVRPTLGRHPWRTPLPGVYLCSSSTPPGPGVHGMCGNNAARLALADLGL